MSYQLALEIGEIELIGSAGEPVFGEPLPANSNADIRRWITGLEGGDHHEGWLRFWFTRC
jgi:hypothetical protein